MMLHQNASKESLGLCRIAVFGLWTLIVLVTPLGRFSELPAEWFEPAGIFRLLPNFFWDIMLNPISLLILKWILVILGLFLVAGVWFYVPLAFGFGFLILLFDMLTKGFGGFFNHAQLGLLYAAWILAIFPQAADGLSVRRRKREENPSSARYAAPMVAMTLTLCLCYSILGVRRLIVGGGGIFLGDALPTYLSVRSLDYGSVAWGFSYGLWILENPLIERLFKAGFFFTTLAEVFSPLCLFSRRFRFFWLLIMIPFHFLTLFTMNIFFWENLLLIVLLVTGLPHLFTPPAVRNGVHPVVFYDGQCGVCHGFVRFLLHHDNQSSFRFSPLQGDTAKELAVSPQGDDPSQWTVMLRDSQGVHARSTASLRALRHLGGFWTLTGLFLWIPPFLRDGVYNLFARYRYRLFGKANVCEIPAPAHRSQFLP